MSSVNQLYTVTVSLPNLSFVALCSIDSFKTLNVYKYTNRIFPRIWHQGFVILHWPRFLVACVNPSTVGRRLFDPIVWYRDENQSHYISMWSTLNEAIHKLTIRLLSKFALLALWYEAKWKRDDLHSLNGTKRAEYTGVKGNPKFIKYLCNIFLVL